MQEMWVRSLGQDDPLEKEMATYSSILAWKNPMDRGAWWATVHGAERSRIRLSTHACTVSFTQVSAPWSVEEKQIEGSRRKLTQPEDQ